MHRLLFWFFLAASLVASLGCSPDFTPYWKVDKLRILAIQADPVVAKEMEPVTLSALLYAPDDQNVEYDWSWCPFRVSAQDDYHCPIDEEDLEALLEEVDADFDVDDPFDLGESAQATFVNIFEAQEVREFCEMVRREIIEEFDDAELAGFLPGGDCSEGYEITVRLEVSTDDDTLAASKRFMLWGGAEEYNKNPAVEDLQVRPADEDDLDELRDRAGWDVDAGAAHHDQWVSVPIDEPLSVVDDIALEMRTLIDSDSLLIYTPPTPQGDNAEQPEPREESIVYRHFVSNGELDSSYLLYVPDENILDEASIAELTFDFSDTDEGEECGRPVDDGCAVDLWSVIRDSRYGVDWIERRLIVVD